MFSTRTRDKHTDVVLSDVYERTLPSVAAGNKFTNSFYKANEGAKNIKRLRSFKMFTQSQTLCRVCSF